MDTIEIPNNLVSLNENLPRNSSDNEKYDETVEEETDPFFSKCRTRSDKDYVNESDSRGKVIDLVVNFKKKKIPKVKYPHTNKIFRRNQRKSR